MKSRDVILLEGMSKPTDMPTRYDVGMHLDVLINNTQISIVSMGVDALVWFTEDLSSQDPWKHLFHR